MVTASLELREEGEEEVGTMASASEIQLAKERLALAKAHEESASKRLFKAKEGMKQAAKMLETLSADVDDALEQFVLSQSEVKKAFKCVKAVEKRREVVTIDSDSDEEGNSKKKKRTSSPTSRGISSTVEHFPQAKSPTMSWMNLWRQMRDVGWVYCAGDLVSWYWVHPSVTKMKKRDMLRDCTDGVHYFSSEKAIQQYAIANLGWKGAEESSEEDEVSSEEEVVMKKRKRGWRRFTSSTI